MSLFNTTSRESGQKAAEISAEDQESIRLRWPIRHTAYAKLHAAALATYPEAFPAQQPESTVPSKPNDNKLTSVTKFVVAENTDVNNPELLRDAYAKLDLIQPAESEQL
jgi:hypothetical protein